MKISYLSDLHLDFWIKIKKSKEKVETYIQNLIDTDEGEKDVVIIAGDISHYNAQSLIALGVFSLNYNKVFYVLGNHDYYLISKSQEKRYKNSNERVQELVEQSEELYPNVHALLDGTVHEYNGVTFSGLTMWYPVENIEQKMFLANYSNDSVYIKGVDIHEMHLKDIKNYCLTLDKNIDMMVSHVPVINVDTHFKYNSTSGYLCPLPDLKVKHWIFGHSHEQKIYEKPYGTFYMNALGYPDEKMLRTIKSFIYEKG